MLKKIYESLSDFLDYIFVKICIFSAIFTLVIPIGAIVFHQFLSIFFPWHSNDFADNGILYSLFNGVFALGLIGCLVMIRDFFYMDSVFLNLEILRRKVDQIAKKLDEYENIDR
jgi:hypothetical protein